MGQNVLIPHIVYYSPGLNKRRISVTKHNFHTKWNILEQSWTCEQTLKQYFKKAFDKLSKILKFFKVTCVVSIK